MVRYRSQVHIAMMRTITVGRGFFFSQEKWEIHGWQEGQQIWERAPKRKHHGEICRAHPASWGRGGGRASWASPKGSPWLSENSVESLKEPLEDSQHADSTLSCAPSPAPVCLLILGRDGKGNPGGANWRRDSYGVISSRKTWANLGGCSEG